MGNEHKKSDSSSKKNIWSKSYESKKNKFGGYETKKYDRSKSNEYKKSDYDSKKDKYSKSKDSKDSKRSKSNDDKKKRMVFVVNHWIEELSFSSFFLFCSNRGSQNKKKNNSINSS